MPEWAPNPLSGFGLTELMLRRTSGAGSAKDHNADSRQGPSSARTDPERDLRATPPVGLRVEYSGPLPTLYSGPLDLAPHMYPTQWWPRRSPVSQTESRAALAITIIRPPVRPELPSAARAWRSRASTPRKALYQFFRVSSTLALGEPKWLSRRQIPREMQPSQLRGTSDGGQEVGPN